MGEYARLFELEMLCIELMTRQQLVEAVRERSECLPVDLREQLDEEPTDRLRLLLVAARLIHALRQLRRHQRGKTSPRD
jgi:hypothetical protein